MREKNQKGKEIYFNYSLQRPNKLDFCVSVCKSLTDFIDHVWESNQNCKVLVSLKDIMNFLSSAGVKMGFCVNIGPVNIGPFVTIVKKTADILKLHRCSSRRKKPTISTFFLLLMITKFFKQSGGSMKNYFFQTSYLFKGTSASVNIELSKIFIYKNIS